MKSLLFLISVSFALLLVGNVDASEDAAVVTPEGDKITTNSSSADDSLSTNSTGSADANENVADKESMRTSIDDKEEQPTEQKHPDSTTSNNTSTADETKSSSPPIQKGPFVDLFGPTLLSLQMVDETHAQLEQHYTNEALSEKKVIGLYFSADWCGPCRQFTPELVNFYNKMNSRRGKEGQFEIVWISRCRDVKSFGQYFTHMNWLALPPEEALGGRGQELASMMKVKGIPHLVLLDEVGNVITYDARNKIPMDKAGIGFPWRSPISILTNLLVPKSLRILLKDRVAGIKKRALSFATKFL